MKYSYFFPFILTNLIAIVLSRDAKRLLAINLDCSVTYVENATSRDITLKCR